MNLTTLIRHESAALPGVAFTVRRLNYITRSERDLALLPDRSRLTAIMRRMEPLVVDGDLSKDEVEVLPGKLDEYRALNAEYAIIHQTRIVPALIRAGFVSIEGLEIEGAAATVEGLLIAAPNALLDEIFAACHAASDLTDKQSKNLQSPGSSDDPEAGLPISTTAASVAP